MGVVEVVVMIVMMAVLVVVVCSGDGICWVSRGGTGGGCGSSGNGCGCGGCGGIRGESRGVSISGCSISGCSISGYGGGRLANDSSDLACRVCGEQQHAWERCS